MDIIENIRLQLTQPPHYSLGFILAGGQSRRMGQDKSKVVVNQHTMLETTQALCDALPLNGHFILGGESADITESSPNSGPASAICEMLSFFADIDFEKLPSLYALVMPVDMPLLSAESIEYLISQYKLLNKGTFYLNNYLPLVVPINTKTITAAARCLQLSDSPSVKYLLAELGAHSIEFKNSTFELINVNTPEDAEKAGKFR
ncbi:molybdenum cofactor guanylyltransferase [Glaciecola sp. 1036]|uniref:molybdenum cofactor guanylyltransferase n=1 Tax=Alteromonadaceae TaxID=72275 RepID=UPI003D020816